MGSWLHGMLGVVLALTDEQQCDSVLSRVKCSFGQKLEEN